MKLPFELPFGKKIPTEYFLALILRDEKVSAVVFEEENGRLKVIGEHHEYFPDSLDATSYDQLLELIDKTLSNAEANLPEGVETQKTIFGVKPDWVHETQIKKEHLGVLKKICDTLGLSPIGFLVIPEAIAHLLSKEEGAPTSGILLEVGKKNLSLSLIRAGKLLETKKTHIEDSIPKATDRILHHFTSHEILPSRIIIFDGQKNEDLQQEFISHSWSKSLPFLHVPQITVLSRRYDAKAMLFGAATQMGFDVLDDNDLPVTKSAVPVAPPLEETLDQPLETAPDEEAIKEPMEAVHEEASTNDFGFVVNGDIEAVQKEKKLSISEESNIAPVPLEELQPEIEEEPELPKHHAASHPIHHKKNSPFDTITQLLSTLPIGSIVSHLKNTKVLQKVSLPSVNLSGSQKPLIVVGIVILALAGLFFAYTNMLTATVTLSLSPNLVEKAETITFSPEEPTDPSEKRVFVETVSVDKEGSLSTPATGTKEVGEAAKGNVTIYNSSLSESRSFPKGTVITAPNGLQFLLDASINVASASGDASSITSSTAKVAVVAKEIGKESNLPSGTKFTIGSLSATSVIAKNDAPFSGGSKKEVTVVAKKDVDKLNAELPKSLEEEAKEEIINQVSDSKELLQDYFNTSLSKTDFDKNTGEEAKSVTLKATVSYQGLAYEKNDLNTLFKSLLESENSEKIVASNSIQYETKKTTINKDGSVKAEISFKGGLVPKINSEEIIKDIQGKSVDEVTTQLNNIDQVENVHVSLSPSLPFLSKFLPRKANNIKVVISTNE